MRTIRLLGLSSSSADFSLQLSGTAARTVNLRSIFFQEVTVNGIALRLLPVTVPLRLKERQPIIGLPDLKATISFRQMPSLRPLVDIVQQKTAHVHAVLLTQVEFNPLQMLALRTGSAWVAATIDQDLQIDLPAGALGQAATLASLAAAEPLWTIGNAAIDWRRQQSEFTAHAEQSLTNSTALITCNFGIQSRTGEISLMRYLSLGMLLAGGKVLTTAEAVEPWSFDPAMAGALSRHQATIIHDSVEISVQVPGESVAFSSRNDGIRIISVNGGAISMISPQTHRRFSLRAQEDDANAVLLELAGVRSAGVALSRTESDEDGQWKKAAVLRADMESGTKRSVWVTEIRRDGGRLVLRDPAGVTAAGSPVWTEEGFAGLLQGSSSAGVLANILEKFPME